MMPSRPMRDEPFFCDSGGTSLRSKPELSTHTQLDLGDQSYRTDCPDCRQTFQRVQVSRCTRRGFYALSVQHLTMDGFHGRTRALSRSKPARPYIWRSITFSRLMCPSSGPLLRRAVMASCTASKSPRSVRANCTKARKPEATAKHRRRRQNSL